MQAARITLFGASILMIGATQVFDGAVVAEPPDVAGFVQAIAGCAERIGDEPGHTLACPQAGPDSSGNG